MDDCRHDRYLYGRFSRCGGRAPGVSPVTSFNAMLVSLFTVLSSGARSSSVNISAITIKNQPPARPGNAYKKSGEPHPCDSPDLFCLLTAGAEMVPAPTARLKDKSKSAPTERQSISLVANLPRPVSERIATQVVMRSDLSCNQFQPNGGLFSLRRSDLNRVELTANESKYVSIELKLLQLS